MRTAVYIGGLNDDATASALRLYRVGVPVVLIAPSRITDLYSHRNFSGVPALGRVERQAVKCQTFADYAYHATSPAQSIEHFITMACAERRIPCLTAEEWKEYADESNDGLLFLMDDALSEIFKGRNALYALRGIKNVSARMYITEDGRVLYPFLDEEAAMEMPAMETIVRSSVEGIVQTIKAPGDTVIKGEPLLFTGMRKITSPVDGVLQGIMSSGAFVKPGDAVAAVSGAESVNCFRLPVRSQAIAGAVLELYFYLKNLK